MTRNSCRALVALSFAFAIPARAQQVTVPPTTRHEVIRGVVTDGAGKPVAAAVVTATRAPDRLFKQATTDASGAYTIDWPEGTGDYLVHVAALGFTPFRKRVTSAIDTLFAVDVKLAPVVAQTLAPVVSIAARAKPTRDAPPLGDPGSTDQTTSGMSGVVPPSLAGDLAAMAATMPGVLPTAQGPSMFGLPGSQNSTTLNGMAFAGADIPRDASTRVRVSGSQYDPARGWFSGANTNVELGPGNIFSSRRARATLDAPPLQYTDATSSQLGQRHTNGQLSMGGDGELVADKWYYNYGIQGGRRDADPASLFTASNALLQQLGVAPDSVERLRALMTGAGIPFSAGLPGRANNDNLSVLARLDHKPYDATSLNAAKSTWGLTGYGRLNQTSRVASSPVAVAGHEGKSSQSIGMAQADYSTYFGPDYLAFFRSGFTVSRSRTSPYLDVPEGRVTVLSDLGNGDGGLQSLAFGGGSGTGTDLRQKTWETTGDLQFFAAGTPRHRVKLNADARLDSYDQDVGANTLGTFGYTTLADFQANTPASFTRTLTSPTRSGGEWNAFFAASDLFRINPRWQLMYGARVEGNLFTAAPAYTPVVDQLFGVRTDNAPQTIHVSPRVGFTWNRSGGIRNANIGTQLGNFSFNAPGVLRGGFGEFRSITPPPLLSLASVSTGLSNGITRVNCIGSAVPIPDWAGYASHSSAIPSACADGSSGSIADAAPSVQLVGPAYQPPRSWRGNLSWASAWKSLNYTVEGTYSLNLNQPATTDLNFSGTERFQLADGRPMYVTPSDIVPGSGLVAASAARSSSQFGRVVESTGDAKSISRQLTITARPDLFGAFGRNMFFLTGYTLSSVRAEQRGFDASAFGDPRKSEWMRGALDARHQFVLQAGTTLRGVTATLTGRAQSGLPFTPMVSGDVNGDGVANDRAFIPDPATTADPSLKAGLQSLIASSSPSVRSCLTTQFNSAARTASCEGPWTATLNGQVSIAGNGGRLSRRATINLGLVNILGGADQLLHGSALRGWGSSPVPDPILLTVTGYNAAAQQFAYAVNPRFGSTRPSANVARAPFQLTLDVAVDIGKPLEAQQVARWLAPGRTKPGDRATAADLQRRFARNVPDMYRLVLQQSDSLLLSRDQVEALTRAQTEYKLRVDAIWSEVAATLADLPKDYNARDASRRLESAIDQAWTMTRDHLQSNLRTILTPVQLALIPGPVKGLVDSTGPVRIRIFLAG